MQLFEESIIDQDIVLKTKNPEKKNFCLKFEVPNFSVELTMLSNSYLLTENRCGYL